MVHSLSENLPVTLPLDSFVLSIATELLPSPDFGPGTLTFLFLHLSSEISIAKLVTSATVFVRFASQSILEVALLMPM